MNQEYIYKKIEKIVFGLLSSKIIKKMAATKIVTAELYDKEGYPVDGGLMDIHLGVIDPGLRCKTCSGKLKECPGHFGYVELARPVVHVKYVKKILIILKSACRECGHILALEKDIQDKNLRGLALLKYLRTVKTCPHCSAKQVPVKLEKPTTFVEDEKRLSPIEIAARFEKLTDDEVELLGINPRYARPEWMVLSVLPVPPVTTRPSITLETGERSEDDLTHKLGDIVRINQRLFENINAGAPEVIVEDLWDLLQYHITTYFDNETTQIPPARHRSGQPLKTLTERIKSKEGRFRHNLVGKRVNFAARTVISPDPKIEFNEVGVPFVIATDLTIPEKVTEWNLTWIKKFVENGPTLYPGANYVITGDGKKKKVTEDSKKQILEEIKPGYIVERHLMDGDVCVFNRQPSLHRMSIMCHKIKVLPGKSFRLNPSVCVAPDTLVQLSSGIQRPIDELKNCWKESELATYDDKNNKIIKTELKKFWGLKPEEYGSKCYKITTESDRSITATGDHPFYTKDSIKKASYLNKDDFVVIRPLDTPVYEEKDKILVTKKDILNNCPKETYTKHTLKLLEELKLVPLNMLDQRAMIISRLLGHLFGDGTFILKKDSGRMIFRGNKKNLEQIQKDIESLGFKPEKIYIKTVNNKIETIKGKILEVRGSGHDFEIRNKPLAILFSCLGAPNGDKVKLRYNVPEWIISSPKYIQREFLASYFGSEMSTPKIRDNSKSNFRSLVFKISKIQDNLSSGMEFVNDIKNILKNFNIKLNVNKVEDGNKRKDGFITKVIVSSIDNETSKINLLGKIGFIYDYKKDNIARLAYHYMLNKQKEVKKRNEKFDLANKLRKKGYKFKQISDIVEISVGNLEKWIYGKYKKSALPSDFISFNDWHIKNADISSGFVYDKVKSIQEVYVPFVYDITTISDTHNFFANGFLTKNCTPYNADFDGDEMNLHVPQTEEARAEAEILMQVQSHIITPKNGLNVVGTLLDAVTGNYMLTKDLSFNRGEAIQMLYNIGVSDFSKLKSGKLVSGKDIFSALLPNDFDFVGNAKNDENVVIKNGRLMEGFIDKATIGEDNGTLIRAIYKKYGEDNGLIIMGSIFKLGIEVLLKIGFTTGINDTDLPEDLLKKNKEKIDETINEINNLIKKYKNNQLEALPGMTTEITLENMILQLLNKLRDKIGETVYENVSDKNSTVLMARSGAQGNFLNLAQMAALVGQQVLRGSRVNVGYKNRTLSSFEQGSLEAETRGFIKNSYRSGINPYEYFFHAMTGRDSLMDTALRTPKSGYLYRRLANALQDIRVEYDGSVRDATKRIIQFSYGDDGLDVSKTEGGIINVKRIVKEVAANV